MFVAQGVWLFITTFTPSRGLRGTMFPSKLASPDIRAEVRVLRDMVIRLSRELVFVEVRLEETQSELEMKTELNNSVI